MKTFIKWPGNKQKHLRYIVPHIPTDFDCYIEPFLGSGSLFLHLQPTNSIINDYNTDLIDIWLLIRNDYKFIIRYFKTFAKKFVTMQIKDKVNFCRDITDKFNVSERSKLRSVQMLCMIYCAFMGIIFINGRFRFQGLENRIYSDDKYYFLTENYFSRIQEISRFLNESNVRIYNTDYKNVLKSAKKNDFVFLDPPYIYDYDVGFNYNQNEELNLQFLHDLFKECKKLDKKKVKWLMTQADTLTIRKIFKDYSIIKYPVYRSIKKEYTSELIIKNY